MTRDPGSGPAPGSSQFDKPGFYVQAYGNNLAATIVLGAGLVWHLLNPPAAATSATLLPAAGELQLDVHADAHS